MTLMEIKYNRVSFLPSILHHRGHYRYPLTLWWQMKKEKNLTLNIYRTLRPQNKTKKHNLRH